MTVVGGQVRTSNKVEYFSLLTSTCGFKILAFTGKTVEKGRDALRLMGMGFPVIVHCENIQKGL
jgi:hypothetical protein